MTTQVVMSHSHDPIGQKRVQYQLQDHQHITIATPLSTAL